MNRRRGFTLLAVLIVMLAALLLTTSLLFMAGADAALLRHTQQSVQDAADVRSAIAVLLHECAAEPHEVPRLREQYDLYAANGETVSIRILAVESESAKLNVNHADVEMLKALSVPDDIANAAIGRRAQLGNFRSLGELLHVEGVTSQLLFGESHFHEPFWKPTTAQDAPNAALASLLTVHEAADASDVDRVAGEAVDLGVQWDDSIRRALEPHLSAETCDSLQAVLEQRMPIEAEHELLMTMAESGIVREQWPAVWQLLRVARSDLPRIDISTASQQVLASLPGFTPALASAVVQRRDAVDDEVRRSRLWPVVEGVVPPEAYAEAICWIGTRTTVVRIRFDVERRPTRSAGESTAVRTAACEAVIDLSGNEPGVLTLRDPASVSMRLPPAAGHSDGSEPETAQFDVVVP